MCRVWEKIFTKRQPSQTFSDSSKKFGWHKLI
ncbi:unnamed protein product [Larinioides sclopetarius]|uniref:Uncharacterized protein n=1 Tax=Larinioides sclopetarius TaxID=280406 RepID=A0AAV2BVR7_9ARAC